MDGPSQQRNLALPSMTIKLTPRITFLEPTQMPLQGWPANIAAMQRQRLPPYYSLRGIFRPASTTDPCIHPCIFLPSREDSLSSYPGERASIKMAYKTAGNASHSLLLSAGSFLQLLFSFTFAFLAILFIRFIDWSRFIHSLTTTYRKFGINSPTPEAFFSPLLYSSNNN